MSYTYIYIHTNVGICIHTQTLNHKIIGFSFVCFSEVVFFFFYIILKNNIIMKATVFPGVGDATFYSLKKSWKYLPCIQQVTHYFKKEILLKIMHLQQQEIC